ncbi:helix-turn-helix transcriptional regulator [Bradyrhizobium sp. 45]|uniref:helix-turn-helix domain-containing protein n=1 Tax=Bradyrhizobium sp. 45 TaxID=1043587 RepID=UPI001FF9A087|nr:helix-turn-helix transcriptional regulator [Bradyrhizobium sp. 45]MCK1310091.1 helix-turn-helix transcriptional regulator [Bradyrhizobium sp. 45]
MMSKKTIRTTKFEASVSEQLPAGRIGARLRAWRRNKNMTLDELALATGLNKSFLSRIEKDAKAPSIATVMKLSRALDIPVALLFGEQVADSDIHLVRTANRQPEEDPVHGYSFCIPIASGAGPTGGSFLNDAAGPLQ